MISTIYGHYLTLDAPWTTDKTAVELNSATGCQLRIVLVLIFRIKEEGYPFETSTDQKCFFSFEFTERFGYETLASVRGGSRIFLGGGALVSCSTSTPINRIVFFCFAEYR